MRQLRLFVIYIPVGIMIISLIIISQIFTATAAAALALALAAAEDQTDIEVKDKDIKEELGTSDTKATNDDNTASETGLEEDNVMIDDTDTYSSDDDNNDDDGDVPFELPFDNIIPFP